MANPLLFVSIHYQEAALPSDAYERVRVDEFGGREVASFATGNPIADWAACLAYLKSRGGAFLLTSSVDHFVFDVPGYRWIEDEEGIEWLVVDERDGTGTPPAADPKAFARLKATPSHERS